VSEEREKMGMEKEKEKEEKEGANLSRRELIVVDTDYSNDSADVSDELVVGIVEVLKVFEGDSSFEFTTSHANSVETFFRFHIQMNNEIWFPHEIGHVLKEGDVGLVVSFVHLPRVLQHLCEYCIFVDGSVLHSTLPLPEDLLMLTKPLIQEIDLKWERITRWILVKV
jgi:hypothetical protein